MLSYNYDIMPNNIEVSPNNRAKCRNCFNKVRKGTPRLILNSTYTYFFNGNKIHFKGNAYVCHNCIDYVLNNLNKGISLLRKGFRKFNRRKLVKATKLILELEPKEELKKTGIISCYSTPMHKNPIYKLFSKGGN